jgi:squalene-associated FAD-dependent desaturase
MVAIHVVGAGMAGQAAALRLPSHDHEVTLYDATGHAGGRCRSFYDDTLEREIDNGNHLILSGNSAANAYLAETDAHDTFVTPKTAVFPFLDLATGESWSIHPNSGRFPWWLFVPERRVPDSRMRDHLPALRLRQANSRTTVEDVLGGDRNLYERFWKPLAVAILNTPPSEACAHLLWPVVVETFGRGGGACRARLTRKGLSHSLIEPALATLHRRGVAVRFGHRLRRIEQANDRAVGLDFNAGQAEIAPTDRVILALPAAVAPTVAPAIDAPDRFHAIINVHFRTERPLSARGPVPFVGLIGGVAEWVFTRGDVISVTISAADALVERSPDEIAAQTWSDVARALDLDDAMPPFRVVKEKRATFAQTPESESRRPGPTTTTKNLFLSGDWTDTGLPATIEGAIRSGYRAAKAALRTIAD